MADRRIRSRRVAIALAAVLSISTWNAHALQSGFIDVKLPENIAYELAPIQIEIGVHHLDRPELVLSYHIYDLFKNDMAHADLTVKPEKGETRQTIAFTPPKWGYYAVLLSVLENGKQISGFARHIGVTPKYPGLHELAKGERPGWSWNCEPLQSFAGLLVDRANGDKPDDAASVLEEGKKYGVTILVQLNNVKPDAVRASVTKLKGQAKYYEIIDEPNAKGITPEKYAEILKEIYPLIKSIDPDALVMGPAIRGIDLDWLKKFDQAGGGKLIDALSFHDVEGDESIDYFHWWRKLSALWAYPAHPLWQTARPICGVRMGLFLGAAQAVRITFQRDMLEVFGVPNDHNIHYYANITGYNTLPAFVIADSGPHPVALACRTRAAMLMGRKFAGTACNFGPISNEVFLGLRYKGEDGQIITTLRNLGTLDQKLKIFVPRGDQLEVVDAFGNIQNVKVKNQQVTVTVSQLPCYLRPAKGQEAFVIDEETRIRNIASQAKFSYSGGSESDPNLLTDCKFQSNFLGSDATPVWSGKYTGKFFNDKPETLEIAFSVPHQIEKLLIFGVHADNSHSALLDYDLQYHDGKDWVTLEEVRTPCPPSDPVRVYHANDGGDDLHRGFYSVAYTWFADNNFFVHQFKQPVKTDKLRLIIRRITRGFVPDMIAEDAVNEGKPVRWKASSETLELREIEIYGDRWPE